MPLRRVATRFHTPNFHFSAYLRSEYNEKLRDYNTFIQQFPNSLWAGIAGYHPNNAYFQASEGSRTAPAVKF